MAVFKRSDSNLYSYDFRLDGQRYHGPTGAETVEEARLFEKGVRDEILSIDGAFRTLLRSARRDIPTKTTAKAGYVYFIRSGYFVKIGHSLDPMERLKTLSCATPEGAALLFWFRGNQQLERRMHREFAASHHQREWFFLCGKLKQFIEMAEKAINAPQQSEKQGVPRSLHASSE